MKENYTVEKIQVSTIDDNSELNCRGYIEVESVMSLAGDIKKEGLMTPITIAEHTPENQKKTGFKYRIVAGFRRFKAMKMLNWVEIPSFIISGAEADLRIINLRENLEREELSLMKQAHALKPLFELGLTREDLKKRLGVKDGWLQTRMYAASMPEDVQKEIEAGLINTEQIRQLYSMKSEPSKMYEAVRKIKEAKEKGENVPVILEQKITRNSTKKREPREILPILEYLTSLCGKNPFSRALAWAAGEISTEDMLSDVEVFCKEKDIEFIYPKELFASERKKKEELYK